MHAVKIHFQNFIGKKEMLCSFVCSEKRGHAHVYVGTCYEEKSAKDFNMSSGGPSLHVHVTRMLAYI